MPTRSIPVRASPAVFLICAVGLMDCQGLADSGEVSITPILNSAASDKKNDASAQGGAAGVGGSSGAGEAGQGAAGSAGEAGSPGSGGENNGGSSGESTGGGGAGGAGGGCAGAGTSTGCGDGVRDPELEECDDGLGSSETLRGCTANCSVLDHPAAAEVCDEERYLGTGRHPVAAAWHGQATAFVVLREAQPPGIAVSTWSPQGQLRGTAVLGSLLLEPGPVVAPLLDGSFALAFTSTSADDDGLGIGLVKVSPDGSAIGPEYRANGTQVFGQHSPDIAAVGDKIVAAWEDDSPLSERTVCYREFFQDLAPAAAEQCEPPDAAWRSHIVLQDLEGALARSWREEGAGGTRVAVAIGSARSFFNVGSVEWDEAPALAPLSTCALLLVHANGDGRLMAAVLDDEAHVLYGPVFLNDTTEPRSHPALARTLDGVYLAWREPGAVASATGDELYLQKLDWDGETLDTATHPVLPLPRQEAHWPGDQRSPALAGACTYLLAAWDELGAGNLSSQCSHGDVVVELVPTPIFRDSP